MASQRLRMYILRRDGFRCVYCGAAPSRFYLHLDHVVPRAKGGVTHPTNLVTACATCNGRKSDQVIQVPVAIQAVLAQEAGFQWTDLRWL